MHKTQIMAKFILAHRQHISSAVENFECRQVHGIRCRRWTQPKANMLIVQEICCINNSL